jgi:hypothetical protein
VEPPAAKGTTNSMGLDGNFSAAPAALKKMKGKHKSSIQMNIFFFPISFLLSKSFKIEIHSRSFRMVSVSFNSGLEAQNS